MLLRDLGQNAIHHQHYYCGYAIRFSIFFCSWLVLEILPYMSPFMLVAVVNLRLRFLFPTN